jgi:hypothetical protein
MRAVRRHLNPGGTHEEDLKKSSGKGKPAVKRGAKDLAPRRTHDVKGGRLTSSMQKKVDDTVSGQQQKIG